MTSEIKVVADAQALAEAAAHAVRDSLLRAVASRGRFDLALTGGRTPVALYERLGGPMRAEIPWEEGHLWWGDERCVPPDDEESNYGLAARTLLRDRSAPGGNIHPMICGARDADEAASRYEDELRSQLGPDPESASPEATFDLLLLGMGEDGHVASLFPSDPALGEPVRWVRAVSAPASRPPRERLTLTLPAINLSSEVLILVSGEAKAEMVAEVLSQQEGGIPLLPAAMVCPRERLCWILDEAAARLVGAGRRT